MSFYGNNSLLIATPKFLVWNGSTDTAWTAPDATSWSGQTYTDNRDVYFNGAGQGTVTINGAVQPKTVNVTNGSYTFSGGTIGGNGSLIVTTSGTVTLSGSNTYTGGTTVNAGTLTAGSLNAFGTGTITVNAGATLNRNGFGITNNIVNNGGTVL